MAMEGYHLGPLWLLPRMVLPSSRYESLAFSEYELLTQSSFVRTSVQVESGECHALAPESVLAGLLHHTDAVASAQGGDAPRQYVISVPSHFTDAQRRAVLDAATISVSVDGVLLLPWVQAAN